MATLLNFTQDNEWQNATISYWKAFHKRSKVVSEYQKLILKNLEISEHKNRLLENRSSGDASNEWWIAHQTLRETENELIITKDTINRLDHLIKDLEEQRLQIENKMTLDIISRSN
jgi:hypothetical protein